MRIFVSELSRCLKVKTIYKFLFWTTLLGGLFIAFLLILWLGRSIPKTEKDFIKEYLYCRLNFSPQTIKQAYYCPLQYKDVYYDARVKGIIDYVKEKQIYQEFILQTLKRIKNNEWQAKGEFIRFTCKSKNQDCLKLIDEIKTIKVYRIKGHYYTIEEEF
jgi:hypothetical protein